MDLKNRGAFLYTHMQITTIKQITKFREKSLALSMPRLNTQSKCGIDYLGRKRERKRREKERKFQIKFRLFVDT